MPESEVNNMCFLNEAMVQEDSEHVILHWNYRGYSTLPLELWKCGNHVSELYLKYNNIKELVLFVVVFLPIPTLSFYLLYLI